MTKERLFQGGEFLITEAMPDEVFTPEDFTKEQRLIGKAAEEFGVGEVAPKRDELKEPNEELIKSLLRKSGELGLLSTDIPEVYGGLGLDKVTSVLVTERINQGVGGFLATYGVQTGIGSLPIVFFGSPEQKEKYLPHLASGEMIGAYALTEPAHGSDALGAETTAVLSDDGKDYIINGQKQFITNAGYADLFLTYAQVAGTKFTPLEKAADFNRRSLPLKADGGLKPPSAQTVRERSSLTGFTGFIVERKWEGVKLDKEEMKMGMHGSSTRSVIFQDVRVPVENVLGDVGRGHVVALNTLNIGRYKLGAAVVGAAKNLIADAVKYARERVQFGKPICEFGLIKHKIAEMVIKIYVSESMGYRIARLLDLALEGIDPTRRDAGQKNGAALSRYALECSINKVFGTEMLDYVADECVQIMGGYGYIQDNLIESAYRDSRINRIWEGTNEINRLLIVDRLIKAATKGELPFTEVIKDTQRELIGYRPAMNEEDGVLEKERRIVAMGKKIALLSAGAAVKKYMDKLGNEQEIVAWLADIIIEIYAMESSLLRALKKVQKEGEEKAKIHIIAAQVYINDSFQKVEVMARQILGVLAEGEELRTQLMGLRKIARHIPINTVARRREIADSIIAAARYHLTKI